MPQLTAQDAVRKDVGIAIYDAGEFTHEMSRQYDQEMMDQERVDTEFTIRISAEISMPKGPSLKISTDGQRAWAELPDDDDPPGWDPQPLSEEQETTCVQYLRQLAPMPA